MNKTRIGFVGTGLMGQCAHLWNYIAIEECEVVALAELRPELARLVGQRYGISKVYTSGAEMLAAESLDAIVSTHPFQRLGQLMPPLLEHGLPVMTEKPIGRSVEVGEKLARLSKKYQAPLYLGYHKRSDPASIFAREQIERWQSSGEVGPMTYVRISIPPGDFVAGGFSHYLQTEEEVAPLQEDPIPDGMDEESARRYDALVNYYIHQVDLIRYLLGEDYQVSFADPGGILMVIQSESGLSGALEMGTYQTSRAWHETALVAFQRGWILLELPPPLAVNRSGRVTVYSDPEGGTPQSVTPDFPNVHAMRNQARNFIKEVNGQATGLCRANDAVKDLVTMRDYLNQLLENQKKI